MMSLSLSLKQLTGYLNYNLITKLNQVCKRGIDQLNFVRMIILFSRHLSAFCP